MDQEKVEIYEIVVATEKEANNIKKKLNNGADFEKIAKESGIGASARRGGRLGWIKRGYYNKDKGAYRRRPD